jgi:hypothetical protein
VAKARDRVDGSAGGGGWNLTPIGIMVRCVELPLPCSPSGTLRRGKGMGVVSILFAGADIGKARVLCLDCLGFSPLGDIVPERSEW